MTKSRIGHRLVRTAVACGVGLFSVAGVAVPASIASASASHPAASSSSSKGLTISSTGLKPGAIKHVWLIILENKSYDATFTGLNQNSYLWKTLPKQGVLLKKYYGTDGKPLDLVQPQLAARFGLPLSLFTYDAALTTQLNQSLYQPSATGTVLAPNTITFHYAQNGLDVVKTFRFDSSYVIHVDASVRRSGGR